MPSKVRNSLDDDISFIFSQLRHMAPGCGLLSVRSRNNIRKALMCLRGAGSTRQMVKNCWKQSLDISPQVFLLFSASLAADSLCRRGVEISRRLIVILQHHQKTIDQHPVINTLVAEYFSSTRTSQSLDGPWSWRLSDSGTASEIDKADTVKNDQIYDKSAGCVVQIYSKHDVGLSAITVKSLLQSLISDNNLRHHLPPSIGEEKLSLQFPLKSKSCGRSIQRDCQ